MEEEDPSPPRGHHHSSPGGIRHRAVTRSVTRNKSQTAGGGADNPDATNFKTARRRLVDKLKSGRNDIDAETSTSKYPADDDGDGVGDEDFCPLKFHGCFPRMRYRKWFLHSAPRN